jgi:hypothetical protein
MTSRRWLWLRDRRRIPEAIRRLFTAEQARPELPLTISMPTR